MKMFQVDKALKIYRSKNGLDSYIKSLNVPTPDLQRPFPTLILKLCTKKELFPFKVGKRVPFHTYFNENNIFLMKLRYSQIMRKFYSN
jgi:hypothetical protein